MQKHIIILKDGRDINTVMNVKGYIEMRLLHRWFEIKRWFDKLDCKLVGDSNNTIVFQVNTSRKIFESIKEEMDVLYPEMCVYLQKRES